MKRPSTKQLLFTLSLILLLLASAAQAGWPPQAAQAANGGPQGKATGGVSGVTISGGVSTPGVELQFQFNAHEKGPKGTASFSTQYGTFFHGTVDCFFQIDENTVAFSGVITKTEAEGWDFFIAFVHDNDEPGNADWFRVSPGSLRPCTSDPWSVSGFVPLGERWEVTAGNIQVH